MACAHSGAEEIDPLNSKPISTNMTKALLILLVTVQSTAYVFGSADSSRRGGPTEELSLLQMVEPLLTKEEKIPYEEVISHLPDNPRQAVLVLEAMDSKRSAIMNFLLGNLYMVTDRTPQGVQALEDSIKAFPNFLQAHRSLANALANLGKLDESLEHATRAISLGGADGRLYGLMAYVHYQKGRHASALSAYRMAAMYDPDNLQYVKGELFSLASTGHHRDVLFRLKELLPSEPNNGEYWMLKANAHLFLEENEKAMVAFETLRQLSKADGATLSRLARLYFNEGLHEESVIVIEEAMKKNGSPSEALTILEAFIALDESDLAYRVSRSLSSVAWSNEDMDERFALAMAQMSLLRGDKKEAESSLRSLLKRFPTQGSALISLAKLLLETDRPDEARIHFERASTFEEVQMNAWHELARLSWSEGDTASTIQWLERIQVVSPTRELMETIERLKRDLSTN